MPQPNSPHIVSPPSSAGQPWDAPSDATVAGWNKVDDNGGPADIHDGHVTGDFPDSAPWRQT